MICPALAERMPICTGDGEFVAYDAQVIW